MPQITINYQSERAQKARLARRLAPRHVYELCVGLGVVLLAAGIALVASVGLAVGWLLAGFAGVLWTIAGWSHMLRDIPPNERAATIDDVLDVDLLAALTPDQSPRQLATAAIRTQGGGFIVQRLELHGFLETLASEQAADSAAVWREAERLRIETQSPTIGGAMLVVALVRTIPNVDQQLARLRLDSNDMLAGLDWYRQLERAIAEHDKRADDGGFGRDWAFGYTPLLDQFGFNISQHRAFDGLWLGIPGKEDAMRQLVRLLSQTGRRNAAIVGGLGAGKTSLVYALAKKLLEADPAVPKGLHYHQIIALDPSTLIAQAQGKGDLEGLVQRLCYEALHAKNIILFLDDAELFFEDGNGAVNLSNILLPILDGGALQLILAMDEQRWLRILRSNPGLAQYMNRVSLAPASEHETMVVMQDQFVTYEYQQHVLYTYQAMSAAYQLSSRYGGEQVMPGRALKLLEAAAGHPEGNVVTRRSVEQAIEQTQGVKVGTADSEVERQTLLNLEQLIHQRMINQTRAVQVVSDALRRARAGVRNEARPIGTFLFLGPTGVGKTELAKSVAAVFFGGEDHLVRLDLNEYAQPSDVSRLIADGAQDPHSLTAQIAKNPFSVVLLDEIEKAHPNVLNTLLQMLDEGILRDINNREISFRDAVVIATSNAGAERIRQHIESGQQLEQFEQQFANELINDNTFRPEFLNRFDEIVLFRPLKPEELLQVVDLILQSINKQLATQKVTVVVQEDAKRMLVDAGYDPRLGARPMRRVVQRVVENIVSNQLLSGQAVPGSQIIIAAPDVQAMLQRGQSA